uniref:Peptidase C1A papain C-terminal domain-containing protein n=1 Tax=Meloidogyne javanica TaxID=6303 RepID=A0A915MG44_MELJA
MRRGLENLQNNHNIVKNTKEDIHNNSKHSILRKEKGLLAPTLPLNNKELKELTETLKELSKLGYSISQEKLLKIAQSVAEINKIAAGEWTAKLSLQTLLPEEAQKSLCGSLDVEANGDNDEPPEANDDDDESPREKREAGRSKRAVSCTYNIEFDARKEWPGCKPIIDYVQNQGYCGSCWAHSVASCYTDRYCIERAKKRVSTPNNATYTFSAFDLLSCSKAKGCDGGLEKDAWKWIETNGICTGTDYERQNGCKPYPFSPTVKNPQLQRCSQSCTNSRWRPTYPTDRKHYGTLKIIEKINLMSSICSDITQKNGPVSAAFVVYEDFQGYKDGVYRYVKGIKKGGHAIVIVGYGTATCGAEKIPFWIIRNSWGPRWGKGGFFYIRRGKDECNIETRGISYGVPKI